ncbi:MAG: acetate--CoA ligase family protein, partial [Acidimicrobiales bacterium]
TDWTGRPLSMRELDLDRFFHPSTVAVIGASDTPDRPTTLNFRFIRAWAEPEGARIYPVNPNRDQVGGIRCYHSVLDIPEEIDLAVILVGDAVAALEDVIEKKAHFVVMFAAGFSEVGEEGAALQRELEASIEASGGHLLGPNTNLNAFERFRTDLPGPSIALITQSGHQGRPIFQGQEIGIAVSQWAPTGNEADLESADFINYFADQEGVGAIACYIEGFKDGRTLMLAADHAAQKGVPIVVVKVGRTDTGRSWAMSHTGHLAGSDDVVSAAFRQYGVVRVEGLDELLDTSMMLARSKPPKGKGVCIYSISGGTSAHMADMATASGLALPELTEETQSQLREWIPGYLRISNPVDNGGHPTGDWRGPKILEAILADPNVDVLVVPITGAFSPISDKFAADLVEAGASTGKPVCVVWGSPAGDEDAYRNVLLRSPLPVFRTFRNCVSALKAYFDYHDFHRSYSSPFAKTVTRPLPAAKKAAGLMASASRSRSVLSEHVSKQVLSAYGIPVSRDILCTSAAEAT